MIEEINLSQYSNRFNQKAIKGLGKVNFIFGKNGTGKSSITQAIKTQYHNKGYNVQIYDGHSKIFGENERLDAIALGEENVSIMKEIEDIDYKIKNKNLILRVYDDNKELVKGLAKDKELIEKSYNKACEELDKFYIDSARIIKQNSDPILIQPGMNYNKNNFENEIKHRELLSEEQVRKYKHDSTSKFIELEDEIEFPTLNVQKFYQETKKLLNKKVSPSKIIKSLDSDKDKKRFAYLGHTIHKHEDSEGNIIHDKKCAFCDNHIDDARWELLDQYFSDEISEFSKEIEIYVKKINSEISLLGAGDSLDSNKYHQSFKEKVNRLNDKIAITINENTIFLNKLIKNLKEKKNNLTNEVILNEIDLPQNFNEMQKEFTMIYKENNFFNEEIDKNKLKAQKSLRFHKIYNLLSDFDYDLKENRVSELKEKLIKNTEEIKSVNNEITILKNKKNTLISKTKSEEKLAHEISDLLNSLGEISFSLELIEKKDEINGQYKIRGDDGELRKITEISEGEKNIIAFLYFMKSLTELEEPNNDPKIIVLDDPMTSNDNTYQYLILGILKEFYGNLNTNALMNTDDMLFVLTHSTYFYINVCPFRKSYRIDHNRRNKEARYYKLIKQNKKSSIMSITNEKDDISSSYSLLWRELKYAFDHNRPKAMWNIMRRILETFSDFNDITLREMLTDNFDDPIDKILGQTMQISLNDNSHSIIDINFEPDTYSADNLLNFFEKIFSRKLNINHFDKYMN